MAEECLDGKSLCVLYCDLLYLMSALNLLKSYDGARILQASGLPSLCVGHV